MQLDIHDPASEALIQKRLASGAYASPEEVVRRALEVLEAEETWTDEERQVLDTKIASSLEQLDRGEGMPAEEVRTRLEKQHAALQAKNLVELFADSPFKGLNIEFDKDRHLDYGREISL